LAPSVIPNQVQLNISLIIRGQPAHFYSMRQSSFLSESLIWIWSQRCNVKLFRCKYTV